MDVKSAAALQLSVIGRSETERLSVIGSSLSVIRKCEISATLLRISRSGIVQTVSALSPIVQTGSAQLTGKREVALFADAGKLSCHFLRSELRVGNT